MKMFDAGVRHHRRHLQRRLSDNWGFVLDQAEIELRRQGVVAGDRAEPWRLVMADDEAVAFIKAAHQLQRGNRRSRRQVGTHQPGGFGGGSAIAGVGSMRCAADGR